MTEAPLLEVSGLEKSYGTTTVLAGVDLVVHSGDVVALVGPNGAGKSTLLRSLAGSESFDAGTISLDGTPADPSSVHYWQRVLAILDDFAWLPDLTVADHLALMSPAHDAGAVASALTTWGGDEWGDRLPDSLSAGQRQRAALSCTAVRPADIVLLDEPEAHLDTAAVQVLADEISRLTTGGAAVVLASHSSILVDLIDCRVVDMSAAAT